MFLRKYVILKTIFNNYLSTCNIINAYGICAHSGDLKMNIVMKKGRKHL